MNDIELNRHRVARLAAAVERVASGNKTEFGKRLGYQDGAFVRQMLSELRPITEKTIRAIEALPGMKGWFDTERTEESDAAPELWPFSAPRESFEKLRPADKKALDKTLTAFITYTLAQYGTQEQKAETPADQETEIKPSRNTMDAGRRSKEAAQAAAEERSSHGSAGSAKRRSGVSR
jgi:hypothetical protein